MLRFGIIGVGNTVAIAHRHAAALNQLPNVQITALFSRTRSRMEAFSRQYCPDAVLCASVQELLELVDCVCICSPNQTHAAYALAALRAGKGVLCEKPLGGTSEELRQLKQLSTKCGLPNLVGYNFRYQAPFKRLREILAAGALGQLLWYQEQKGGNRLSDPAIPYEWRMSRDSGGGSTMDFCSHMLDHFLFLSGTTADALRLRCAQLETCIPQRPDGAGGMRAVETEDFTHLSFTAPGNVSVVLTASRIGMPCDCLEVVCTNGMAFWSERQPQTLLLWQKDASGRMPAAPEALFCPGTLQQTYDAQARAFVDAWLHARSIQPQLSYGCAILELLQQAIQSAQPASSAQP